MSALLTLASVSARTPEHRVLFDSLTLSIASERVGLVGRNGSGKSTLLRIVAGEIDAAAGTIRQSGTIGILAQDWPAGITIADALGMSDGMAILRRILAGDGGAEDFDTAHWTSDALIGGESYRLLGQGAIRAMPTGGRQKKDGKES